MNTAVRYPNESNKQISMQWVNNFNLSFMRAAIYSRHATINSILSEIKEWHNCLQTV